jgi:hypothetical protein
MQPAVQHKLEKNKKIERDREKKGSSMKGYHSVLPLTTASTTSH